MSMTTMTMRQMRSAARPARKSNYAQDRVNVGGQERLVSLLGGGLLACYGLTRGTTSGLLLAGVGAALAYRGATGHCHMYQTLGISSAETKETTAIPSGQGVRIEESVTILKPAGELFAFWRRLENLPRVMKHLISVKDCGGNRSHWVAKGLTGNVEWDAEIINERANELLAWKSLDDSQVQTAGSVHFCEAPGGRGTEIRVVLSYNPPAGQLGATIAWLAGRDPQSQVREDLRSFKQLMETGTLPTTEGQPRGTCC
jgi:uncharacterized membrane protein